tara:strand:+ start:424 stop:561 length:138 start_codon:yes stop_codon:yes gene_type:complete
LDELEMIAGIISLLIGMATFSGVIIYFNQTMKAKVKVGEKVAPSQ